MSANDQLEQERRMLEWRLRQQQRQSEEDGRWLAEEESHLVAFNNSINLIMIHLFFIYFTLSKNDLNLYCCLLFKTFCKYGDNVIDSIFKINESIL